MKGENRNTPSARPLLVRFLLCHCNARCQCQFPRHPSVQGYGKSGRAVPLCAYSWTKPGSPRPQQNCVFAYFLGTTVLQTVLSRRFSRRF
jgi:hypothetical protein